MSETERTEITFVLEPKVQCTCEILLLLPLIRYLQLEKSRRVMLNLCPEGADAVLVRQWLDVVVVQPPLRQPRRRPPALCPMMEVDCYYQKQLALAGIGGNFMTAWQHPAAVRGLKRDMAREQTVFDLFVPKSSQHSFSLVLGPWPAANTPSRGSAGTFHVEVSSADLDNLVDYLSMIEAAKQIYVTQVDFWILCQFAEPQRWSSQHCSCLLQPDHGSWSMLSSVSRPDRIQWSLPSGQAAHTCHVGLGDLLLAKMALMSNGLRFDLCFDLSASRTMRSHDPRFEAFLRWLVARLFPGSNALFLERSPIPMLFFPSHFDITQLSMMQYFDARPFFPVTTGKYVVLHTRCRSDVAGFAARYGGAIVEFLAALSTQANTTVVLLGEQKVSHNVESATQDISSLYGLFTKHLAGAAVLDLTSAEMGNCPDPNTFERDVRIIFHAHNNIGFGIGGNMIITAAFARVMMWFPGARVNGTVVLTVHKLRSAVCFLEASGVVLPSSFVIEPSENIAGFLNRCLARCAVA
jgi:hypothetical protein